MGLSFTRAVERGRDCLEKEAEIARPGIVGREWCRLSLQRIVGKEPLRGRMAWPRQYRQDEKSDRSSHRDRSRSIPRRHQNRLREMSLMLQIQRRPSRLLAMSNRITMASLTRARNPIPPL